MRAFLKISIVFCFALAAFFNAMAQDARLSFDPKWQFAAPLSTSNSSFLEFRNSLHPEQKKLIPQAWCYADLALFCKLEVKMEKATRFPVKFRLGDVEYVDRLEGKRAWR